MARQFIFLLIAFFFIHGSLCSSAARTHSIAAGDTFESIAKKYGITASQLRSRNPRVDECTVGLMLEIPEPGKSFYSSGPAAAGYEDYEKWKELRFSKNKKMVKLAVESLKKAYDAGYYDAVIDYSIVLQYGQHGTKKDVVKSLSVLYTAASKGHPDAQYEIYDRAYSTDRKQYPGSFPSDEVLTIWLKESAEGNQHKAMGSLAHHYLLGLKVEKDSVKAVDLYEKIVLMEPTGLSWSVYYDGALEYLTKLRSHLKGNGQEAYSKGASLVDQGQYDLAHVYFLKGSDLGNVKSMVSLAKDFETGRGVDITSKKLSNGMKQPQIRMIRAQKPQPKH